ncbi:sensor domain-containing diguanylate cyclase [Paraburkholderia sp. J67]|uniref:GGDEF domain-containing protein n=1 Tax=Paraburkholderia sp. J67 TaxID=2805435 RepID=UPI002ABD6262|nr:sensor domain-containing diguanylate cyclase [Paraburkholderia sp. J67]
MTPRSVVAPFVSVGRLLRRWSTRLLAALDAHPNLISVAGVLCAVVVLAGTVATLTADRAGRVERAQEHAQSVANVVAIGISANMNVYDALLGEMADEAHNPATPLMTDNVRERIRFGQAISHQLLDDAFIVGADGTLDVPLDNPAAARVDLHDRDYFQAFAHGRSQGLYVSQPFESRIRDGHRSVALARSVAGPGEAFEGVAVLVVRLDSLQRFIGSFETRDVDAVRVVRDDGLVLAQARRPSDTDDSAEATALAVQDPADEAIARLDAASETGRTAHVRGTSLAVVATPSTEQTLHSWRRQAFWQGALGIAFALTLAVGSMGLESALRSRNQALEQLREMSLTDGLTGLFNRRALDTRLDEEWRRAVRKHYPFSILFIDIDRFKLFNDEYGHAVGDEVLRSVAQCVGAHARRAQDMAARYGGEEFAVVLPDTDAQEAARIAEAIRHAVQALRIAHTKSEAGAVTVSVGCASVAAAAGVEGGAEQLLQAADAQLLRAKSSGRNRVVATVLDTPGAAATPEEHAQA